MNELVKYTTDSGEVALDKQTIKNYLVSGDASKVTDQELELFINLCKYQKLNPFLREAYLVKFGTAPANMIVGKDFFVKRAALNENFKEWQAGIIILNKNNEIIERAGSFYAPQVETLVGGWCKILKKDGTEFYHTVSMQEYNSGQSTWKKIPATMIRKVALVQALRECFPDDFQGLYDSAEMGVNENYLVDKKVDINNPTISVEQNKILMDRVGKDKVIKFCKEHNYKSSGEITVQEYSKLVADAEAQKEEVIEAEIVEDDKAEQETLFNPDTEDLPF